MLLHKMFQVVSILVIYWYFNVHNLLQYVVVISKPQSGSSLTCTTYSLSNLIKQSTTITD